MSGDDDDWKKEVQKSNPGTSGRSSKTGRFVNSGKSGKTAKTGKSGRSSTTGKGAWVTHSADGWTIVNARGVESGHFRTQKDAIDGARKIIKNSGGGELRIYGKNGAIRGTKTIKPDEHKPTKG